MNIDVPTGGSTFGYWTVVEPLVSGSLRRGTATTRVQCPHEIRCVSTRSLLNNTYDPHRLDGWTWTDEYGWQQSGNLLLPKGASSHQ